MEPGTQIRRCAGMLVAWLVLVACTTPAEPPPDIAPAEVPAQGGEALVLEDGATYRGEIVAGLMHGRGRFDNGAGLVYDGDWKDGKRHGHGTETRPDGSRYSGSWEAGKRSGSGRETWPDGSYHDGEWEYNQPRGPGMRHYADGTEITGTFAGDVATSGMLTLPSGEIFAGPMHAPNGNLHPKLDRWLKTTAAGGDPWAGLLRARHLLRAPTPGNVPAEALELLQIAESAGLAEAAFLLGLHQQGEPAIEHLRRGASRGHAGAARLLGERLLAQCGTAACREEALVHLRAAASRGDHDAVRALALALLPADPVEARKVIDSQARSFGHWRDLVVLGRVESALGNPSEALRLLELALMNGGQNDATMDAAEADRLQREIEQQRQAITTGGSR